MKNKRITVGKAVALFLEHRELRVSPNSLDRYELETRRWLSWRQKHELAHPVHSVTLDELTQFFLYLQNDSGLAPATCECNWRCIKSLWLFLGRRGYLLKEQLAFFDRDIGIPRPRVPDEIQENYDIETIEQLLANVPELGRPDPEREARNRLIILLLWETGMRASEMCSLEDERVNLLERAGVIMGKGGKERWVFWHERTAQALELYLQHRRGPWGGALLRDLEEGEPLTTNAARKMLKRLAERAGVQLPKKSPLHAFRRRFADDVLEADIDGLYLQQLLGHASIVSTMVYVRKSPVGLQRIHRRIGEKLAS